MEFLDLPPGLTFGELPSLNEELGAAIASNPALQHLETQIPVPPQLQVCSFIDDLARHLKREDLIFTQEYQVKAIFEDSAGKWSNIFKESVYIDSKYFVATY